MPAIPTLSGIFRYPVKSMAGQALDNTELTRHGVLGDRVWAIRDESRGGFRAGKRYPALMSCSARFLKEPDAAHRSADVELTLADGTVIETSDTGVNDALSRCVGSAVSLWPLLPEDALDHYRRPPADPDADVEAGLREVFARTPDEPLPDLSAFPRELFEYESPPGTYFDAYPILIMTTASLAAMQERAAESRVDVRRFRPNLLVDTDAAGFPEDDWCGRHVTIGTARLKVDMPCPRCVMTTHPVADLPRDPGIMRALVAGNSGNLGVYASVETPSVVAIGDTVQLD